MAEIAEPILRPEFSAFQQEMRSDMRDLRDGMIRSDARADQSDKRMGAFESQLTIGLDNIRTDIRSLRSIRTWVIGGVAAGGSAVGAAIWHAILTGLHP